MRQPRRGITLIEILVVFAILAILAAILLPALQLARETAAKTQCLNNLKQIAQALKSYHETHNVFPPGQVANARKFSSDDIGNFVNPAEARSLDPADIPNAQGTSWMLHILPLIDQAGLYEQWDFSKNVRNNGDGGGPAQRDIAIFYCPSRRSSMEATGQYASTLRVDQSWTSGGNDYAGCTGSGFSFKDDVDLEQQTYHLTAAQFAKTILPATGPSAARSPFTQDSAHIGIFGVNSSTRMAAITSGTSTTMMVSERQIFVNPQSGHPEQRSSDGWAFGGPATLFSTRLAPVNSGWIPTSGNHTNRHFDEAGSAHPQIVNIVMADGSGRSISYNIDLGTWNKFGSMELGATADF